MTHGGVVWDSAGLGPARILPGSCLDPAWVLPVRTLYLLCSVYDNAYSLAFTLALVWRPAPGGLPWSLPCIFCRSGGSPCMYVI